jgi:hypothetical protein
MGTVTIPQLPAATGLTGDELVVLSQSGTMKSAAISAMLELVPTTVQVLSPPVTGTTITPTVLNTIVMPLYSGAAITLTINPGASSGQRVMVYGGAYAVTVQSNVSSGYPEFFFPDGSTSHSWTLTAGVYAQYIDMTWDGVNWRCATSG